MDIIKFRVVHSDEQYKGDPQRCFVCRSKFSNGWKHTIKVGDKSKELYLCSKQCLTKLLIAEHLLMFSPLATLSDDELEDFFDFLTHHLTTHHPLSLEDLDKTDKIPPKLIDKLCKILF